MRPSQIYALERIMLEAAPADADELVRFYRDVIELDLVEQAPDHLCFRSAQISLMIVLRGTPTVEPTRRRATLSVRSLSAAAERLEQEHLAFTRVSGLSWTDRRLSLLDPAGNRVELKQEWRAGAFASPQERSLLPVEAGTHGGEKSENTP